MRFLLLAFLTLSTLLFADDLNQTRTAFDADDNISSETNNSAMLSEEDLYLSYEVLPKRLYEHQVFSLTVKIVNTNKDNQAIWRAYGAMEGVKLLSKKPITSYDNYTIYDTYYFQVLAPTFKLPDFFYKLTRSDQERYKPKRLPGKYMTAVQLQYNQDFSHLLAESFEISGYKTTNYDNTHNIIVFSVKTRMGNVEDFNLTIALNQGFESAVYELPETRMTYFAVIPKHLRHVNFSYFDINSSHYISQSIPIEVNDDSVSTQMDLAPTQYTHTVAKIIIASGLALLGLILYLIKRKKRYFFIIALAPILYLSWVYFPKERLCIKADAKVHLLPMKHATIFKKSSIVEHLQKLGKVGEYNKVLLTNGNIGWIKNEDICEN